MEHYDIIIIGGGINGAGVARDCALRGLKVLILDKNDFASGTSSRSTKLVHGGIRYLENKEFKLVWESCHERKILTDIAPQLVRTIPFIIPVYKGDKRPAWLVKIGMFLYDLMAGFRNVQRHRNLSAKKMLRLMPQLKPQGLTGGGIYYDCQTDDARLTLANIQDAVSHGATAKNYTEVSTIRTYEKGFEVECQDVITSEKTNYTACYIVNATGPWLDENLQKWHLSNQKHLRLTKGIHFFVPKLSDEYALLIGAQRDNRVFFVIPHGEYSLIGTTDTDYLGDPDKVEATNDDIQYLLDEVNRLFPALHLTLKDVSGVYSGLRPLLKTEEVKEGSVSREYLLKEEKLGGSTYLNVIGGKLTTYRNLAEKVTDQAIVALSKLAGPGCNIKTDYAGCTTGIRHLIGSNFEEKTLEEYEKNLLKRNTMLRSLPGEIAHNLIQTYGSEIHNVLPYLSREGGLGRIIPESPVVWGQLWYGKDHEFVRTAQDFINRRTELYIKAKDHSGLTALIEKELRK